MADAVFWSIKHPILALEALIQKSVSAQEFFHHDLVNALDEQCAALEQEISIKVEKIWEKRHWLIRKSLFIPAKTVSLCWSTFCCARTTTLWAAPHATIFITGATFRLPVGLLKFTLETAAELIVTAYYLAKTLLGRVYNLLPFTINATLLRPLSYKLPFYNSQTENDYLHLFAQYSWKAAASLRELWSFSVEAGLETLESMDDAALLQGYRDLLGKTWSAEERVAILNHLIERLGRESLLSCEPVSLIALFADLLPTPLCSLGTPDQNAAFTYQVIRLLAAAPPLKHADLPSYIKLLTWLGHYDIEPAVTCVIEWLKPYRPLSPLPDSLVATTPLAFIRNREAERSVYKQMFTAAAGNPDLLQKALHDNFKQIYENSLQQIEFAEWEMALQAVPKPSHESSEEVASIAPDNLLFPQVVYPLLFKKHVLFFEREPTEQQIKEELAAMHATLLMALITKGVDKAGEAATSLINAVLSEEQLFDLWQRQPTGPGMFSELNLHLLKKATEIVRQNQDLALAQRLFGPLFVQCTALMERIGMLVSLHAQWEEAVADYRAAGGPRKLGVGFTSG